MMTCMSTISVHVLLFYNKNLCFIPWFLDEDPSLLGIILLPNRRPEVPKSKLYDDIGSHDPLLPSTSLVAYEAFALPKRAPFFS